MRTAIIIGGGIGGLTTAIALRRMGVDAQVYERASEMREVGAGLSLWVNAIKALRKIGLAEAVRAAGAAGGRSIEKPGESVPGGVRPAFAARPRAMADAVTGPVSHDLFSPVVENPVEKMKSLEIAAFFSTRNPLFPAPKRWYDRHSPSPGPLDDRAP